MEQQSLLQSGHEGVRPEFSQAIQGLWNVLKNHADAYAKLRETHIELNNRLLLNGKEQQAKEKEQARLVQEHKTLSDRVKALERSLHQSSGLQQSYDELQAEMQSVKRNAAKYDSEIALRQEQIHVLEEKLAQSESMQKTLKKSMSALLEAALEQQEFPETDSDLEIATGLLLKEFRQRTIDSEDKLDEIKELKSEILRLEENAKDGVRFSDNDEIRKLTKEIEQLKTENKELLLSEKEITPDEHTKSLLSKIEDKDAEIKELILQHELKLSDMDSIKEQLHAAEELLDAEKEQVRLLKEQVIALRDLHPEASSRQSSLESSKEKLRQERDDLKTTLKELKKEIEEKDQLITTLKSTKGDLFDEVGYNAIIVENKSLKAERESLADQLESLKNRLDKAINN